MAKLYADKKTKRLYTEAKIKELGQNIRSFAATWQGQINILDPEKSNIAVELEIHEKGEYAIKVRG